MKLYLDLFPLYILIIDHFGEGDMLEDCKLEKLQEEFLKIMRDDTQIMPLIHKKACYYKYSHFDQWELTLTGMKKANFIFKQMFPYHYQLFEHSGLNFSRKKKY